MLGRGELISLAGRSGAVLQSWCRPCLHSYIFHPAERHALWQLEPSKCVFLVFWAVIDFWDRPDVLLVDNLHSSLIFVSLTARLTCTS